MQHVLQFGCPFIFKAAWQAWVFLALPSVLAALGARLTQGSALRIVGATLGASLRDAVLLGLIYAGYLVPSNGRYDHYAGSLLLLFVSSGGALGAVFSPYRGLLLMIMAAVGAAAGQFAYGYLPLALIVALALHVKGRQRNCALPTA